ncbi:hypothetical protein ZIOFF_003360 [Zingiber officinale]|uniref:BED-type domain-containing protein n=1 Tax=Zingiber officinale TaxID=94328 RepID=A0A8J5MA55_ZINOF|nr:hypothetical protein ZIOFF_003360 [Zingiber officinale]
MSSTTSKTKEKNASGSRTDIGWQHGVDVDNNSKKGRCKYCDKTFSDGIFRFKHHLAGTHRDVESCLTVPDDVKNKMRSVMDKLAKVADKRKRKSYGIDDLDDEEPLPKAIEKGKMKMDTFSRSKKGSDFGSTQATINQMMKKELRDEACQEIARFIYGCAIPFNCVKHPSFQKMFELVGRYGCGFKAPTYHEVREMLKKEVNQTKELLEVFEMLDEIIDEVGGENVVQVITDNAANYKVHTKKRNRLQQKKMNDLVFVMSNMKMINRKSKKEELFTIDDLSSDDEWITEENDHIDGDDGEDLDQTMKLMVMMWSQSI